MEIIKALGIDVGGTKTAWGVVDLDGVLLDSGSFPTPPERETFIHALQEVVREHPSHGVGVGIAGTLSKNHQETLVCTNLPHLSELPLASLLREAGAILTSLDNDARCAMIGEVWLGAAASYTSAVLLTLGTGVGGAVMQRGSVLPHPSDVSQELGRIMVDPSDVFPAVSGAGTIEAFIGGRNLEERLEISLGEIAEKAEHGDAEALDTWHVISDYFQECVRAVHDQYSSKVIIIGGKGCKDLPLYLGNHEYPCPIIPAALGSEAGIYGAARLALDLYDEQQTDWE